MKRTIAQTNCSDILQWILIGLVGLLILLSPMLSSASTPPAYTVIKNQAYVTYYNDGLDLYERVDSNVVKTEVGAVPALTFSPDLTQQASIGQEVIFSQEVTNTGNVILTPIITYSADSASNFNLSNLQFYIDTNHNGVPDADDIPFNLGASLPALAIGATYQILTIGNVPNSAVIGNKSLFKLTVQATGSKNETASDMVENRVDVVDVGAIRIFETANVSRATPNSIIKYTVTALQASGGDTQPAYLDIDGANYAKVFIRSPIPNQTVFYGVSNVAGAQPLYHLKNAPTDNYYVSTPPADLSEVDAIAFAWDVFPSGVTHQVSFEVRTNASLDDTVINQSVVYQTISGTQSLSKSNKVLLSPAQKGGLSFYRDDSYTSLTGTSYPGSPLYLGSFAQACNVDKTKVESYFVTLNSVFAKDEETGILLVETGPNTGFFTAQIPTDLLSENVPVLNNGIVTVNDDDTVTAVLNCHGKTYSSDVIITDSYLRTVYYNFSGKIFDSRHISVGIPNAVVSLYQTVDDPFTTLTPSTNPVVQSSSPLISLSNPRAATGFSKLVKQTTTDASGHYELPPIVADLVGPSASFYLVVTAANFSYPSIFSASVYPAFRVNAFASYEYPFNVSQDGSFNIDVPLDRVATPGQGLIIEKSVDKETVEYGQVLTYTIKYKNIEADMSFLHVTLQDVLPRGFAYVDGSTRLNGVAASDPKGAPGPNLTFTVGQVYGGQSGEITYQVEVRNSAPEGTAVNTAQMLSHEGNSNTSSASVKVKKNGVFSDEAFVLGTIFADCNDNKQKDVDEPGVPFVRLYLEDGTFVISDAEGRFSLYGLTPRTHVMKVDSSTLPKGAILTELNNRFAKDAKSRFVDLKKGELHRADFAIKNCTPTIMEEIKQRQGSWTVDSVNQKLTSIGDSNLSSLDPYNAGDVKAKPSQGLLDGQGKVITEKALLPLAGTNTMSSYLPNNPSAVSHGPVIPPETLIKTISNDIDFIDIADQQLLRSAQQTIKVKGPLQGKLVLYVNGHRISDDRIGKKMRLESRDIQINEYVGVNLQSGINHLKVVLEDGSKTPKVKIIAVAVPGKLSRIEIQPIQKGIADGVTPLPILVRLLDKQGLPVYGRHLVTLESNKGQWQIDNSKPNPLGGFDAFIENGETIFNLVNSEPGEVGIRVTANLVKQALDVRFSPNLRPLIAVGVIEGAVGLRDLKEKDIEAVSNTDNFEESIRTTFGNEGQRGAVGLRGAMFLKGKVKGDYLLTLAYDSDKKTKDQMFRDIDPSKFYPIYGDDSIKGFDAQATSELYVRIDKGNSFMLYGDYATQDSSFADSMTVKGQTLGRYQRNLTGFKGQYAGKYVKTTYFAAYSDTKQKVITFDGRGISGPYDVNMNTFVKNSEVVEIITRSQSQPALIINREPLTRFTDYTFDAFYNTILFNRPIPSIDINGNPVQIQITYEVETGGDRYWVYGGSGDVFITENISVGATYAEDKDPSIKYRLWSAHTVFDFSPTIGFALEMAQSRGIDQSLTTAQSNSTDLIKGKGYRAELVANTADSRLKSRTYFVKTDENFRNDAAGVSAGREDIGATVQYQINDQFVLNGEGLQTKDRKQSSRRTGWLVAAEHSLGENFSGRLGSRYVKEKTDNSDKIDDDLTSVFARLSWKPTLLPDLLAFVEAEQAVNHGKQHMFAVGSEYALSKKVSLYGRHEFISELGLGSTSSVSGSFGMAGNSFNTNRNATTFGMKYNYASNSSIFSEYRIANAIDGRQAEASVGLNNGWEVMDGLGLTTTFERIQPFSQGKEGLATAATFALDYTGSDHWKGTTRIEWRHSKNLQTWLHTIGVARKLDRDWSVLASNIYGLEQRRDNSGDRTRDDARIGLAYRDSKFNKLNALFRYQLLLDNDKQNNDDSRHHILSSHANYQLHPKLVASGRYAISRNRFNVNQLKTRNTSQLVMGRVTYDLTEHIDFGIMGSRLFGNKAYQHGYGTEMGYLMGKNVWFSVGYNFMGFKDKVLSGSDYTQKGAYIRLRIKFDEDMFQWLTD